MYLLFSFPLHAILIPDISSPIYLSSPESVYRDTAHDLAKELQRTVEKKESPLAAFCSALPSPSPN